VDLTLLTLLGALLALDGTAVGQFMVSRPLVAGTLAGWVLGDPALGLLVGGILELYSIPVFPVGGGEFPEGGPPAVVAVAAAWALPGPGGVALGTLLGLVWSRLGTLSIRALRRMNETLIPDPAAEAVSPGSVVGAQVAATAMEFLRGGFLTLLGLLSASRLAVFAPEAWPLGWPGTLTFLGLGAALPFGAMVGALGGWQRRGALFLAGVAASLLMGLL